ncbi:hypothetical protein Ciccas_012688 [Cichlidogyrus casuarinus]|uniref:Uncharacterized protein n=1 Tax=Cichlidogyrus casuarinus TaxID=1844966 RepID=A0ABD2PMR3_9PLAT
MSEAQTSDLEGDKFQSHMETNGKDTLIQSQNAEFAIWPVRKDAWLLLDFPERDKDADAISSACQEMGYPKVAKTRRLGQERVGQAARPRIVKIKFMEPVPRDVLTASGSSASDAPPSVKLVQIRRILPSVDAARKEWLISLSVNVHVCVRITLEAGVQMERVLQIADDLQNTSSKQS